MRGVRGAGVSILQSLLDVTNLLILITTNNIMLDTLLSTIKCNCVSLIATVLFIYILKHIVESLSVDNGSMDNATKILLEKQTTQNLVPSECLGIVQALETAETLHEEAACAAQMRNIIAQEHLKFSTLVKEPEILLRCSVGMQGSNGALWTRYTVQYNLYAGSIVAMGSDEQRQQLFDSQSEGQLGCFAFTECGAGVLSGAGVETTATYDAVSRSFVIHSPTESSTKNWISQGKATP